MSCTWVPEKYEHVGKAWAKIQKMLSDGRWHSWGKVVAEVMRESEMKPASVHGVVYNAISHGRVCKTGHYARKTGEDFRAIRLMEKPVTHSCNWPRR